MNYASKTKLIFLTPRKPPTGTKAKGSSVCGCYLIIISKLHEKVSTVVTTHLGIA